MKRETHRSIHLHPVLLRHGSIQDIVKQLVHLWVFRSACSRLVVNGNQHRLSRVIIKPVVQAKEHVFNSCCGTQKCFGYENEIKFSGSGHERLSTHSGETQGCRCPDCTRREGRIRVCLRSGIEGWNVPGSETPPVGEDWCANVKLCFENRWRMLLTDRCNPAALLGWHRCNSLNKEFSAHG